MHVLLDAELLPFSAIEDIKNVLASFPGEAEVVLEMATRAGPRKLRLGPAYRVAASPTLRAELEHVLGPAAVRSG
jgi:hypothetical protein